METLTAAPPPAPPSSTAVDTHPDGWRPCFVCATWLPTEGDGSSWPWTGPGRRICEPCLRKVDQ